MGFGSSSEAIVILVPFTSSGTHIDVELTDHLEFVAIVTLVTMLKLFRQFRCFFLIT